MVHCILVIGVYIIETCKSIVTRIMCFVNMDKLFYINLYLKSAIGLYMKMTCFEGEESMQYSGVPLIVVIFQILNMIFIIF